MKKKMAILATLGLAGAAWYNHRNKKYPLAKGYRIFNKFVLNGSLVTIPVAKFANKVLSLESLPALADDLQRDSISIMTRDHAQIRLSIYKNKKASDKQPCLIYFHGGGFCLQDEGYIHKIVMHYAIYSKCSVVFVHYRTSDRYPFPTPFYDCVDAFEYVWHHGDDLNLDINRLAVGGDSAGGALAASITHYCKDHHIPLCFQLLIYPVIDMRMDTPSAKRYKDGPSWNSSMSESMWKIYLRNGIQEKIEYASPILAHDFNGLPAAYIEISKFDALHDEGLNYANALKNGGISVQLVENKGCMHGFDFLLNNPITKTAITRRCDALYHAFYK